MTTRKRSQVSSLDLFLDTICNAFGGIMFISILIAILFQMRGNEPETIELHDGLTEAQARQMQSQLSDLQRQIEIISDSIAIREKALFNENTVAARNLQSQRDALTEQLEALRAIQQSLLESSAKGYEEIQEAQQELVELDKRLQDAKSAVAARSKEFEDALTAAETTTALPKVSPTNKGNLLFAMRYGKLYLLSISDGLGADGINDEHVVSTPRDEGVQVTLKKNAGWVLDSPKAKADLRKLMKAHSSLTSFFTVAVWPDSFPEFLKLKELMVKEGYDYDLQPVEDLESLVIVSSSSATVQ